MMAKTTLEKPSRVHNSCNSGLYLANVYRTPVKFSSVSVHGKSFCYIILPVLEGKIQIGEVICLNYFTVSLIYNLYIYYIYII